MEGGDLRMVGVDRGRALDVFVDGAEVRAYQGESIAAALFASGRRFTRWTARTGEPRGYFCGMGVCQDDLVTSARVILLNYGRKAAVQQCLHIERGHDETDERQIGRLGVDQRFHANNSCSLRQDRK